MESATFSSSPDRRRVDIFDEYANRPFSVISSIDDLDTEAKLKYKEVDLGERKVFVREDILSEAEKRAAHIFASDKTTEKLFSLGLAREVHRVLRPILRRAYERKDSKEQALDEQKKRETLSHLIRNIEAGEIKRIELARFVSSFPPEVQKSLKEGAFLIESEGRSYPVVQEGSESIMMTDFDARFESKKAGSWKRGLFQTLRAGSPYVRSYLPSSMSGTVSVFSAELKDDNVTATVEGSNLSAYGDNELIVYVQFKENSEEKQVTRSFAPFD